MTTLTPAPAPAPENPLRETRPAHLLDPTPPSNRRWRGALVAVAVTLLVLALGGLATGTVLRAVDDARFQEIPSTQDLGRPSTLVLTTDIADVQVRTDPSAAQVSLRLVPSDGDPSPSSGAVRAQVDVSDIRGTADGRSVRVELPHSSVGGFPWDMDSRDVELVVPTELAATMDLSLRTDIGDVDITGDYAAVSVVASTGDVELAVGGVTGDVSAVSSLGNISMRIEEGSTPTSILARADTGDVDVAVPGTDSYLLTTRSDLGEVVVDPGIGAAHGTRLTATSDLGEVSVTR